jgi:hypothetical protein
MKKLLTTLSIFIIFGGVIAIPAIIYLQNTSVAELFENKLSISKKDKDSFSLSEKEASFLDKIGLFENDQEKSSFNGFSIAKDTEESPLAIIIENHGLAQPNQSGISNASIVYETYAEGGITRFMVLFPSKSPNKIGPVRSLRPYFLDWALEHTHTIIHAGGSEEALENLYFSKLTDIDEDELDESKLYRDNSLEKPHNLFANLEEIRDTLPSPENDWKKMPFQFSEQEPDGEIANSVDILFGDSYDAGFEYDSNNKKYTRYQRGSKHLDQLNNKPLSPSNIIVQYTDMEVIDDIGRLDIRTEGSGKSRFFSQGKTIPGTWKKTMAGVTAFLDNSGVPYPLLPGQTWIIIIDSSSKVQYE